MALEYGWMERSRETGLSRAPTSHGGVNTRIRETFPFLLFSSLLFSAFLFSSFLFVSFFHSLLFSSFLLRFFRDAEQPFFQRQSLMQLRAQSAGLCSRGQHLSSHSECSGNTDHPRSLFRVLWNASLCALSTLGKPFWRHVVAADVVSKIEKCRTEFRGEFLLLAVF